LVVGGFDHGGHGLQHGGTTSMAAGLDMGPTHLDPGAAIFFILENWSFVSVGNSQYLKVDIFGILRLVSASIDDTNNMFTADTLDPFCSSDIESIQIKCEKKKALPKSRHRRRGLVQLIDGFIHTHISSNGGDPSPVLLTSMSSDSFKGRSQRCHTRFYDQIVYS
jgi:hypothetical protein